MKLVVDVPEGNYKALKKMSGCCGLGVYHEMILNGTPLSEELEKLKSEIIKEKCDKCEVDYNIQKCYDDNTIGWCDVFDNLTIIDNHINELKGE